MSLDISGMWTLLLRSWNIRSDFADCHLAFPAVKMQGKAPAVVNEEKRSAVFGPVMQWTDSNLMADAVFCPHQLSVSLV